ncbi:WXG100 family type VII secretion target [Cryobacterium sp. SO1]|uniref:WXG100 family type VII secretion target n=1 Tax=Cryobacterium sp. SO1 TaxID=1897061 RepID=UPI001022D8F1|nr:WXG100 family type VII secretion target [Cryobacterium sp. SO1]RZI34287.1 hypothetical protein BJQ95_03428 [Cryobacterium sp. SO1]
MANLNVTYDEMDDAAKRLQNGQMDLESKLGELKNLVGGLVSGGFVTEKASVAFEATYTDFNESATKMVGSLDGISEYIKQAALALRGTDEELAKVIKG